MVASWLECVESGSKAGRKPVETDIKCYHLPDMTSLNFYKIK